MPNHSSDRNTGDKQGIGTDGDLRTSPNLELIWQVVVPTIDVDHMGVARRVNAHFKTKAAPKRPYQRYINVKIMKYEENSLGGCRYSGIGSGEYISELTTGEIDLGDEEGIVLGVLRILHRGKLVKLSIC